MRNHRDLARWRPIPSCPGYSASDYGRVYSDHAGRMLIGSNDRYGYRNVNITVDGKAVRRKVHRLVCEAWRGPPPAGTQCGHLDGNPQNNRPENLAWVTAKENASHKKAQGRPNGGAVGAQHPMAKLSDEQVTQIRASEGVSVRALASQHGVSSAQISRIRSGKKWAQGNAPKGAA